jgi:transcriptional regulator with XRE-family HTH domain
MDYFRYILIMKKKSIVREIGQKIRILRKIKKMSQVELANKARLHQTLIGKIERAEINPTVASLEKIANAFNIPLAELFTFAKGKGVVDTDIKTLNKAIEILKHILEETKELTKN